MHPREVEHLGFWVFDIKPKFGKKIKGNIIATEEMSIRSDKGFALSNE